MTKKNARHPNVETHRDYASATPVRRSLKPKTAMPGSPIEENARQGRVETQMPGASATPAMALLKPTAVVPGSPSNARQRPIEAQSSNASETPARRTLKPIDAVPGSASNARHTRPETHLGRASATPAIYPLESKPAVPGSPIENARHKVHEAHVGVASATPANTALKPIATVPGSPIENARQARLETQLCSASAASTTLAMKPKQGVSRPSSKGRLCTVETQPPNATSTPATGVVKSKPALPGSPFSSVIEAIRAHHRERRFAMGIQQVLDRKLESYIRINKTEWHVGDDETTREKANKEVAAKIKVARKGEGDPSIIKVVRMTDHARGPADAERARHEKEMESLACSLPVAPWVRTVPGLGYLGLATIVAETGDLANYANVAKVWKRLGYAPYNGLAGSSWKRETWREGRKALTKEEWIENPFSGKRYSLLHVISVWLKNKQWIGAAKTDTGVGKPNGPYGEVYAKRRAHTAATHPDWSKQHSHMDALRVMMKEVLKDLYLEWNPHKKSAGRHRRLETQKYDATAATPASPRVKSIEAVPGSPIPENARHNTSEAHNARASATPATAQLKPSHRVPGSPIHAA